jgi:dienelactone hydrolase
MSRLQFYAIPTWALVDEVTPIRLRGIQPGQPVTIRLRSVDGVNRVWESFAEFGAAEDGCIDLADAAPAQGTYTGVDATGLFWSRALTGEMDNAARVTGVWHITAHIAGQIVASVSQERRHTSPDVASIPVRDDGLVGTLFTPAGSGRHAAVLVVGGSGGGLSLRETGIAALLASRGYAAMALAYFGMEGLPATLDRIPLEYFERALFWLRRHPRIDPERIAALGGSRGGELVLLLGAMFPSVRAVVAYAPSGLTYGSYPFSGHSAWTYDNVEIPFLLQMSDDAFDAALQKAVADGRPTDDVSVYLAYEPSVASATIPVERINGSVILISGGMDGQWPAERLADVAFHRLRAHAFPHRHEHWRYPDAGHHIGLPNVPTTEIRFTHPVSGADIDHGGTPRATAHASSESWARLLRFLDDTFGS